MINQLTSSLQTSVDTTDLNAIRLAARQDSPDALKAAARQFEALFMNMVLKSMRSATPQDSIFDSNQTRMYTSMLDQEISQSFAKRGIGLADAMIRQMSRNNSNGVPLTDINSTPDAPQDGLVKTLLTPAIGEQQTAQSQAAQIIMQESMEKRKKALLDSLASMGSGHASLADGIASLSDLALAPKEMMSTDSLRNALTETIRQQQSLLVAHQPVSSNSHSSWSNSSQPAHVRAFQEKLAAHAEAASSVTGIPAKFMLGQAALESGWGKRVIKAADGTSSHNLFGIKAGKSWKGRVVETTTTEYVNGVAYRKKEKFRAYDSYAESFRDYARLLSANPRYRNVLANAQDAVGFAQGLQRAGYATDPRYAAKLTRIIQYSLSA